MYLQYFGLSEAPFSITPDPAFVYLSAAHRDALAHLLYGVGQGGSSGFVQLTGEVGTGKTTLCRCLLEQVPDDCQVALVLNPLMTPRELLATICEELGLDVAAVSDSNKAMVDRLNAYLLEQHARGRRVVVVIDEAQNLSPEALEQVRLLTNLETAKDKLLQMVLLGQPELRQLLQRQNLRQLAQRITARYHLAPLNEEETRGYVSHRMKVAGAARSPFRKGALRALYRRSLGIPRLINIIADRALAAAYAQEAPAVTAHMVNAAADEVQPSESRVRPNRWPLAVAAAVILALLLGVTMRFLPQFRPGGAGDSLASAAPAPAVAPDPVLTAPEAAGRPTTTNGTAATDPPAEAEGGTAVTPSLQTVTAMEMDPPSSAPPAMTSLAAVAQPVESLDPTWLDNQHVGAWRGLGELWNSPGGARAIQAACDGSVGVGFACIREQGNWSRIRQLGLPVLLVLRGEQARLLLLRGLDSRALLVGQGPEPLRVAPAAVENRWLGEYYVAWPQAPEWPLEIHRGESGAAVDIVMEMAELAEPAWNGPAAFDSEFEAWLMSFQRRNGLQADGIIGPNTLIYLMAPTVAEPRLLLQSAEGS